MSSLSNDILLQAKAGSEYLSELRRWFHMHPELAREEFLTQQKIESELDALGLPHKRAAGTGVYAEIRGTADKGAGKTILLRADIDALPVDEKSDVPYRSETPGRMHACGHDAHAASLLGAAKILCENRDKFSGTVRLVFQPGEEIGYGGRVIVSEGLVDGADRTFGIHMASELPCGKIAVVPGANNASCDWFKITVRGLGAHVSRPERGVDALYIASQTVVSAQAILTRRISPMENLLIAFGKLTAGTAYNCVADCAEIEGTTRAFSPELRSQANSELEALAKSTAAIYGGTAEVEWRDNASPLINDPASCEEAQKVASELFGPENVVTSRVPSLGADDMADFINRVPGCYAYVGSSNPDFPNSCVAHHNDHFDIDEKCLTAASAMYAAYAIAFLNRKV